MFLTIFKDIFFIDIVSSLPGCGDHRFGSRAERKGNLRFPRMQGQPPSGWGILHRARMGLYTPLEQNSYYFDKEPLLRIKLIDGGETLHFLSAGDFKVENDLGETVIERISTFRKWRIRLESCEPAQFVYALLAGTWKNQGDAEAKASSLRLKGHDSRIEKVGGGPRLTGKQGFDNTHYRVLLGTFNSAGEAMASGWNLLEDSPVDVVREKLREARGTLEICDEQYEKAVRIENGITIRPYDGNTIVLYDMLNGEEENHWKIENMQWPLFFRIGDDGGLVAVGEIPLETYLVGVVSSEMNPDFPDEALKSQAIASRSYTLANLGLCHPESLYDMCSNSHCQSFKGPAHWHPAAHSAVNATHGVVLRTKDGICEAPTHPVCGGFTEGQNLFWSLRARETLLYDGPKDKASYRSLRGESIVSEWISSHPDVYCNPDRSALPLFFKNVQSGFRWEVYVTRHALEALVLQNSGEDIGTLYDILPKERSESGRLSEIEILGSRKNLRICDAFHIRRILSWNMLKSSCFVVEADMGDDGIPLGFSFIGAGQGHGIGLCQAGAAALALKGMQCREILAHYFPHAEQIKVYG